MNRAPDLSTNRTAKPAPNSELVAASLLVVVHLAVAPGLAVSGEHPGGTSASTISSSPAATQAIDAFCDGLAPTTKKKEPRRVVGLFRKDPQDKGQWMEFKGEPELEAAEKVDQVYDVARVRTTEDGSMSISMSLTSGSRDWVNYVEYCFRASGKLARMNSTLNTFSAVDNDREGVGASRVRDRYFDQDGRQLEVRQRVLDLKTKQPAPGISLMDHEDPVYESVDALPFHGLLKTRGAAQSIAAPVEASPGR